MQPGYKIIINMTQAHSLLIYLRADTWNILQNSGVLARHHRGVHRDLLLRVDDLLGALGHLGPGLGRGGAGVHGGGHGARHGHAPPRLRPGVGRPPQPRRHRRRRGDQARLAAPRRALRVRAVRRRPVEVRAQAQACTRTYVSARAHSCSAAVDGLDQHGTEVRVC